MGIDTIVVGLDIEIRRLTQARKLLAGLNGTKATRSGRPPMSAAARKKIAAAQRKRWRTLKKAA